MLVCVVLAKADAQAPSPFDLIPRLDEAQRRVALGIEDPSATSAEGPPANPFDIVRDGGPAGQQPTIQRIDPIVAEGLERVPGVDVGAERGTFDTILAAALLALLTATFLLQRSTLWRMVDAAFNRNSLTRLLREQQRGSYVVWAFVGALLVASFGYVAVRELRPAWLSARWSALDGFMLAVIGLAVAKLGALQVLKAAFPLDVPVTRYQMLILIWLGMLGVVAFPLVVLVSFAPAAVATAVAWAGAVVVAGGYAFLCLTAASSATGLATGFPVQFMLYLCALEIGPLLVSFTWLSRGLLFG